MRKLVCFLLVFVCTISSCKKEKKNNFKGTIGLTVLSLDNPYFKALADAAQEEAAKNGYNVLVTSGDFDPSKQRNQINDFIIKEVDAIILTPVDSKSSGIVVRKCNEMDIPVFTADMTTTDSLAHVVSYIATDNFSGGKQAADALIEALEGKIKKVLILDFPAAESCLNRVAGFKERIEEYNTHNSLEQIEIVAQLPCNAQRDQGFKATSDAIQTYPDLTGIFAINDPGALGAVGALEKANKLEQVVVIGFDGQPEGKEAIRDGKMYADPIQFPRKIGRETVKAIMQYLNGYEVPSVLLIETSLYKQADGLADKEIKEYH